jgi:hypothetical protein
MAGAVRLGCVALRPVLVALAALAVLAVLGPLGPLGDARADAPRPDLRMRMRVADGDPHAIEKYLARGQQLFDEQEYAAVIQALTPVTRDARATRAQRLRALELIALSHFIRNDQGAARMTFERILDIDPGYQLRDTSGSPKIREFFDELKRRLIPGYNPQAGADLEHAAPTAGTAARPIELEVRATRGADRVFELVAGVRRRGELGYRLVPGAPRGGGSWRFRITPEPSAKPYVLEYYVEARDAGGAPLGRIAAPDAPLEIALSAGTAETRRWYRRWYVIAGAGALVAAGATGIAIAATRGPGPGTLPPGTVTVTP